MIRLLLSVFILIAAATYGVHLYFNPMDEARVLANQVALMVAAEAALYVAGAYLLLSAAYAVQEWKRHKSVYTRIAQQELEHMCQVHERQYGNRCTVDPRGPEPVRPPVVKPVRK